MTERKNIGRILQDLGRVSQAEIDRAVEFQRREGGYFGQALVRLGIVQQEELEWGLASQFDLPYVFPDAASVAPDAAALVTPGWALRHTALPMTLVEDRVTLAVASPLQTDPAEELSRRTGLQVDLALASAVSIRRVIREVYARKARHRAEDLAEGSAIALGELRALIHRGSASRWGISVREGRALGWYEVEGELHRFRLRIDWESALDRTLSPPPEERLPIRGEATWLAQFRQGPGPRTVEVRGISTSAGYELLFTPREPEEGEPDPPLPPEDLVEELRLLTEDDGVTLAVRSRPEGLGRALLPRLPGLVLPRGHRLLCLTGEEPSQGDPGVLTLPLQGEEGSLERRLRELSEFRFDAVALELAPEEGEIWRAARELAPFVFVFLARGGGTVDSPVPSDIDWVLEIDGEDGGEWTWQLSTQDG
jgi:type IV pilus assembly protein PilB